MRLFRIHSATFKKESPVNQQISAPQGFVTYVFERDFHFDEKRIKSIWTKLQRRETFTQGQLFPYRVEFSASSQAGEFLPGELNIHHGPLLSVHGAIGEINSSYRSLNYFYGSYVISFRLVRPVSLEFFREVGSMKVRLTSHIRPWFKPLWQLGNQILWFGFKFSISQ